MTAFNNRSDSLYPPLTKTRIPETAEEIASKLRYQNLITIGAFLPGDSRDINVPISNNDIPWLNPTLIQQGREFVQRHWFAVFLAHYVALIVGTAQRHGISVMIRTGRSHKRENSLKRYLSTALHVQTWYEADGPEVIRDMRKVRRLHAKAFQMFFSVPNPVKDIRLDDDKKLLLQAIKDDIKVVSGPEQVLPGYINSYEPEVPISQLAMVVTQFMFMGYIVLFPKVFGIYDTKSVAGFCHLWAVLGKYIGIEDEFNLGLHPDTALMRRLFEEICIPGLKESDDVTMVFWDAITYGIQQIRSFVTMNSLLLFMTKDLIGIEKGRNFVKFVSWYDWLCYNLLHFLCAYLLKWRLVRWIANLETRRIMFLAKKRYM